MKKVLILVFITSVLFSLTGCGSGVAPKEIAAPAVSNIPSETDRAAETITPAISASTPEFLSVSTDNSGPKEKDPDAVDVDLTQLSSTMVYAEVYAMVCEPEQYIGKTVKMNGLFATQEYNGTRLYACIVQDATACCSQGLEFELSGSHVYPDDYPEIGAEITVIGTFDTYLEDAGNGEYYIYLVLRNARFV